MKKIMLLMLAVAGLSGCATIMRGSVQAINVSPSNGKETKAIVTSASGTMPVLLPQAIAVKDSSSDIVINVTESECVVPSVTMVNSSLSPWFFGNIIFGGLLGSTTDSVSGAAWEYGTNVLVNVATKEDCQKK